MAEQTRDEMRTAAGGSSMPTASGRAARPGFIGQIGTTLEMIKFEHSVFALPFALTGAMLAARGWPSGRQLFWLIVAMVGARSAAMAFNRIADLRFDAANPRTRTRALPAGHLSLRFAAAFTAASAGLLLLAAYELSSLAFRLSPVVLAILLLYSYVKRFTWLSHLILGICLGLSPVAARVALRGGLDAGVLVLGLAVACWVAGFDMIYACQDIEFDRAAGLHSLPRHFGVAATLYASAGLHVLTMALLALTARLEHLGLIAGAGLVAVALLLAYEHWLVKPRDLSRVNAAFFTVNGYISVLFFVTWAADILAH